MSYRRVLIVVAALVIARPVLAQKPPSSWGVVASVTPNWTVADRTKYFFGGGEVAMDGSEFTIGVARGRELSGDWGFSYVRMKVNDGSTVSDTEAQCEVFSNGCFTFGEKRITRGVMLSGIKANKFVSFVTIKRRVQIGLNMGVIGQNIYGIIVFMSVATTLIAPPLLKLAFGSPTEVEQEIIRQG